MGDQLRNNVDLADDWLDSSNAIVKSALDPEETAVWVGRPSSRLGLAMKEWNLGLVGVALLVFTLTWSIGVAIGGSNNWDHGKPVPRFASHNVLIATLFGLWFLPPTLILLSSPFRAWIRSPGIFYVLTNRRAVVCQVDHHGCSVVGELWPEEVDLLVIKERLDGSGDLIFGDRPVWRTGFTRPFGFLCVADVLDVWALLKKTLISVAR